MASNIFQNLLRSSSFPRPALVPPAQLWQSAIGRATLHLRGQYVPRRSSARSIDQVYSPHYPLVDHNFKRSISHVSPRHEQWKLDMPHPAYYDMEPGEKPILHTVGDELDPEVAKGIRLLISANHILHHHGLVDAFGHVSIRYPEKQNVFLLAGYDPGAPALISSRKHFIEYRTDTCTPIHEDQPKGYSERFIHGLIYSTYPDVQCVVHSHSEAVIPFTAAGIQVKPVFHMAGFLGVNGPPTFYPGEHSPSIMNKHDPYTPDMLIKTPTLGEDLARRFRWTPTYEFDKHPARIDAPVVLQVKHGFTAVGESIQQAVYRAIYTQKNCALLKDALDLCGGDVDKIKYLTEDETKACAKMNLMTQDKAFRLWLREVDPKVNPLYQNEEGHPGAQDLYVRGMGEGEETPGEGKEETAEVTEKTAVGRGIESSIHGPTSHHHATKFFDKS